MVTPQEGQMERDKGIAVATSLESCDSLNDVPM